MMRIFLFGSLIVIALTTPWYVSLIGMAVYALWYEGIELIVLGFILDSYMGHAMPWLSLPAMYTLSVVGILVFTWGIRPMLFITYDEPSL